MNLNFFNLDPKIQRNVIPLRDLIYDYDNAIKLGDIITTSKGYDFVMLGHNIWKDITSGITWYDVEPKTYTFDKAVKTFGDRLPTKEEFTIAESHGFREILPNMKNNWFWSSSVHPNSTDYAYGFHGYSGNGYYDVRDLSDSVRCIERGNVLGKTRAVSVL